MKALAIQLLNLQKLFLMMIMMMMMMMMMKKKKKKKMMMIMLMVTLMTTTRTSHTDQNVLENNSSVLNPVILIKVYSTRYISVI